MRGLASAFGGSFWSHVGNFALGANLRASSSRLLPLYSNSIFAVMEGKKNESTSYLPGNFSTSKKNRGGGNKMNSQKQVWAPKHQKLMADLKAAAVNVVETSKEVAESSTSTVKLSARARVTATFHPKFENEKSDQEVRTKMIQVVSDKNGVLEVSLKHSGSLFLYSGNKTGGAFAKNSYGNLYTAVGVFVLGRTLKEAWGSLAELKQRKFNQYLEENRLCIAMELVTAVLGDHGQRPLQDYVVVTAVTSLRGQPVFYSTAEVVAFCHEWRLPTNQMWLFSTKDSVANFFSAYDALCEEGIASGVVKVLDEMADLSVPGTKSHQELQGEILEGLVARIVDPHSMSSMESLRPYPIPQKHDGPTNLGAGLREICSSNRESEEKQMQALLQAVGSNMCPRTNDWFEEKTAGADTQLLGKFLQASPSDFSTLKLQELCLTIQAKKLHVRFKCRPVSHVNVDDDDDDDPKTFRMTIHVLADAVFRKYQNEMRKQPGLWPLYRGFFVDIDLFHNRAEKNELSADLATDQLSYLNITGKEGDFLMLKLKFLPYKIRTFLIRNGLAPLSKGVSEYKNYYMRQLKNWGTSVAKQKEVGQLLDEWAVHAKKYVQDKKLNASYLSVAEPFLEKYAKRSPKNYRLIGAAGSVINVEQFLAVTKEGNDDEEESYQDFESANKSSSGTDQNSVNPLKAKGVLVVFPGIPGCAKSVLCSEIQKMSEFGHQHHLMGDLTKGKYWQILAEQRKRRPAAMTLADKNAPNEDVWDQIETICENTWAMCVPVIADSTGTECNPYSLDDLAVFMYRVLQRDQHPGKLDKNSPNPGAVLLMFYSLYNGKDRKDFEGDLLDRFGHLIKMPLLRPDRDPMPTEVLKIIEEGIRLHKKQINKHGRQDLAKGSLKDVWSAWEAQLKDVLTKHSEYLISIQISLQDAVKSVVDQLREICSAGYFMHVPKVSEGRSFQTYAFVAITLPRDEIAMAIEKIVAENSEAQRFIKEINWTASLSITHVTLAHKISHGIAAVAAYGSQRGSPATVQISALLYSDKLCALEVKLNAGDKEPTINSRNSWPHVTLWTGKGMKPKDANSLPELVEQGEAKRINIKNPYNVTGRIDFLS